MLNKTRKKARAKTKSALRVRPATAGLAVIAAVVILFLLFIFIQKDSSLREACLKNTKNHGSKCAYYLEVADSKKLRTAGLSGRDEMDDNRGMLFVFDNADQQCIWMRGMRFKLDIIWLNRKKEIIKLARDVPPATYPATFCPDGPAQYVIELNARQAKSAGYRVGDKLDF